MKNRIKDILGSKKIICMVTICTVFLCVLIVTIFLINQKQDKNGKETEIAEEEKTEKVTTSSRKEMASSSKKKELGPWTDYNAFIEEVKAWLEDDSMAITTKDLDVSPMLGVMKVKENAYGYVPGYYLMDLDSDGIGELLFGYRDMGSSECGILDIYTMKDGLVSHVAGVENMLDLEVLFHDGFHLFENGNIKRYEYSSSDVYGIDWKVDTTYYTFRNGELQPAEAFDNEYAERDILFTPFIEIVVPDEYEDNENLTYADLTGKEFWFYSGAGAWNTTLTINADGTFTGCYQDYDVKHIYECNFSGRFSDLTKTGPYEYTMKCKSLKTKQEPGESETRGEYFVDYTEPYGFDDAEEFKIYLPGKKWSELPGGFLSWAHGEAATGYLACYGIYNVGGKQGFMEMDFSWNEGTDDE